MSQKKAGGVGGGGQWHGQRRDLELENLEVECFHGKMMS